jgi:lipid intermediate transporter
MKPSIVRLGTLLLLFDVYLTWARIEKQTVPDRRESNLGKLAQLPIILQYLFFCKYTSPSYHRDSSG